MGPVTPPMMEKGVHFYGTTFVTFFVDVDTHPGPSMAVIDDPPTTDGSFRVIL